MKGDEVVDMGEEGTDCTLFRLVWHKGFDCFEHSNCKSRLRGLTGVLTKIHASKKVKHEAGVIAFVGAYSYGMFSEIGLAICGIDVSTKCSLSAYECIQTIMVVMIRVAPQTVSAIDGIWAAVCDIACRNEIPTLKLRG